MVHRPIGVDLFCGAGGMSLGFEQAGFKVVAAVDFNPIHTATHDRNFPFCKSITRDLSLVTGDDIRQAIQLDAPIDVVFGGPPCQGISLMGHRNANDPRNQMILEFARIISELQPSYFVLENVVGIMSGYGLELIEQFKSYLRNHEYDTVAPIQVLNASEFGVPQQRLRTFILGYKRNKKQPYYPQPLNTNNNTYVPPSVREAISDLPNVDLYPELANNDLYTHELIPTMSHYAQLLRGDIFDETDLSWVNPLKPRGLTGCQRTSHTLAVKDRFMQVPQGGYDSISRFHRLSEQGLSNTIRAGTLSDHGSHTAARPIHPTQPRCITVRESARLQSFPDWFVFDNRKWHALQQIGNAVPPLLARSVAKEFYKVIKDDLDSSNRA